MALNSLQDILNKFHDRINPKTGDPWTEDEMAERVASHVNDALGGQNWERINMKNYILKTIRYLFFAPDWELSQVRQLIKASGGGFDITRPQTMFANTPEAYLARKNLAMQAIGAATVTQALNFAFTGHFSWGNEEGHKMQIQLPFKDPEGKNIYVDTANTALLNYALQAAHAIIDASGEPDWAKKPAVLLHPIFGKAHPFIKAGVEYGASLISPNQKRSKTHPDKPSTSEVLRARAAGEVIPSPLGAAGVAREYAPQPWGQGKKFGGLGSIAPDILQLLGGGFPQTGPRGPYTPYKPGTGTSVTPSGGLRVGNVTLTSGGGMRISPPMRDNSTPMSRLSELLNTMIFGGKHTPTPTAPVNPLEQLVQ